jgi:putative Holliday junction resolvase
MGRTAAVDYGRVRIGLAISDPRGVIASPHSVLTAARSQGPSRHAEDARRVLAWAREQDVDRIVVGLPLNMDGSRGPQAREVESFARQLGAAEIAVELWDERLTTFQADELLHARDMTRAQRKRRRDALAAQIILQSFLDHQAGQ